MTESGRSPAAAQVVLAGAYQAAASTVEDQIDLIHRAWELMQRRTELIDADPSAAAGFDPLVILIDDFIALRGALLPGCSRLETKTDPSKPLAEVASIANRGRAARVFVGLSVRGSATDCGATVGGAT